MPPAEIETGLGWYWKMGAKGVADTVSTAPRLVTEPAELLTTTE